MKHSKKSEAPASAFNLQGYATKRVLITGAGGYLGSTLALTLEPFAQELTLVSRNATDLPFANTAHCKEYVGDILEAAFWNQALEGVDTLFHLAAAAPPALLASCRNSRTLSRLIYASSAGILAANEKGFVTNDSPLRPTNRLGMEKANAEKTIEDLARATGLETVAVRLCDVYGPGYTPELTLRPQLNRMIHQAVDDGEITLFANQECTRDYLFIEDAIEGFLRIACHRFAKKSNRLILGSGEATNFKNLANLLADRVEALLGDRPQIRQDKNASLDKSEWRTAKTDGSELQLLLSWRPKTRLAQGIDATINSFRENQRSA